MTELSVRIAPITSINIGHLLWMSGCQASCDPAPSTGQSIQTHRGQTGKIQPHQTHHIHGLRSAPCDWVLGKSRFNSLYYSWCWKIPLAVSRLLLWTKQAGVSKPNLVNIFIDADKIQDTEHLLLWMYNRVQITLHWEIQAWRCLRMTH